MSRRLSPSLTMASGTLVSRMTGLVRTAGLAAVLGVGLVSDAYIAASVVPTMLLVLVTGGTLSSALVPMLSRPVDLEGRRRAAGTSLVALAAVAAVGSVALALSAPLLARLLSAGARGQPDYDERVRLVSLLLVFFAPQVLLLAVTAVTSAVLTARGRLGVVGWAPVTTNLAFLLSLAAYAVLDPAGPSGRLPLSAVALLGAGSTLAAAVGCGVQLRAARDSLPPGRSLLKHRDASLLRELRRTGGWTLLYAATNQVGLLVVLAVAARRNGVGSAYQWSFTVMQLPFALIGVTLLAATLPALARAVDDRTSFDRLVRKASVPLLTLLVPCSAALALFAPLAAGLLVGYGAADGDGTALVARGIALFAAALVPFAAYQLLVRSCYALRHPSWPAKANIAVTAVTLAGAALAVLPARADGVLTVLVLSYAASYLVGCLALGVALTRAGVGVTGGLGRTLLTSGTATSFAVGAVFALRAALPAGWPRDLACLVSFAALCLPGVLPGLRPLIVRARRPVPTVGVDRAEGGARDPAS